MRSLIVVALTIPLWLTAAALAHAQAPPSCYGMAPTIVGTNGNDNLAGTSGPDVIVGLAGNDNITGGGGADRICGGGGTDTITGGDGNDFLDGGPGNDTLSGGSGTDNCLSGGGTDTKTGCETAFQPTPPTANNDGPYIVLEDAAPAVVTGPPGVLANDTDPSGPPPLTAVLATPPAHDSSFTLNANGSFSYAPEANYCGPDSFTYRARDGGGLLSTPATVSITVACVNDPPSFTKGPDQTVDENAGPQTVNPWATGISAGPPNESGQTLAFNVTNNTNPSLFSAGPAVSPTGVLTYRARRLR